MAGAPQPQPDKGPAPWYATVVGALFAIVVLAGAGLATAASYDNEQGHAGGHSEDADHSEDGEHSEDSEHSEDGDHAEEE